MALVHGLPAPIGEHVPIDIDHLAPLGRYQHRPRGLGGPDALELPQQRTPQRALLAPPQQRLERRLVGIEPREAVGTHQGRNKQRLKAAQQRRLAGMPPGKVVARLRVWSKVHSRACSTSPRLRPA
jgi:hypothetical protein